MKGLPSLIRLQKRKLEEERRKLGELESLAHGFLAQIEALERRAEEESVRARAAPETGHVLGGFVQATLGRRATLRTSLAEVEREIAVIREKVAAAFGELKRYEIAQRRRDARAAKEARRRERLFDDEVGLNLHRRRTGAASG